MPDHSFGGRFVLRKSTLICIIVIVCLAGRQSDRIEAGDAGAGQPDNRAGMIEAAYKAYNLQLPEPIETKTEFTIYLFADRRQWEDFTNNFAGEQAEIFRLIKAGAYCHNGTCVAYDIGSERTFSVLAHEGWHQFSSRHFKFRLPSWLDEGVAMLFETQAAGDGTFV